MEKYSELYLGYDIDWFAVDHNKEVAFFASGGGRLPISILEYFDNYFIDSKSFLDFPYILGNEIVINPSLEQIHHFSSLEEKERYLQVYIDMGRKGFYCYDKTNVMADGDNSYHLVLKPSKPVNISDLPQSYVTLLLKARYNGMFRDTTIMDSDESVS